MKPKKDIQLFGKEIVRINGVRFYEGYFQRRRCYGVQQLSTGYATVFEYNKNILSSLIDLVRSGANIGRAGGVNLHIYHASQKYMSLAKYLYCQYYGIDTDSPNISNNIRHRKKRYCQLIEDGRIDNLYTGGFSVVVNINDVSIVSNVKGCKDEFDNIPILVEILNKEHIEFYFSRKDRLMGVVKEKIRFTIADLAYLAYYEKLTVENYIDKLAELKEYKKKNGLNIEHLDGNYHNHRKYNIALVKAKLNSQKSDFVKYIKEPYFFTAVMNDRKYKIFIGYTVDDYIVYSDLFITEHFKNVVELLEKCRVSRPDIFDKEEAIANNKGLFLGDTYRKVLANTADKHFIDLDEQVSPTEAAEGV